MTYSTKINITNKQLFQVVYSTLSRNKFENSCTQRCLNIHGFMLFLVFMNERELYVL